ncbi:MAG: hypothetical protein ACXVB9_07250 [Bdellovibrionota bacterium]
MPRTLNKISLLALLVLAALQSRAFADSRGGSAVPLSLSPLTAEEKNNPDIVKPVDPVVDCNFELTAQEKGTLRENSGIKDIGKKCLPQQDAFKRSAEAASYLAIYQQNFSDYGLAMKDPKIRAGIQKSVAACVTKGAGDPDCHQTDLVKALVQYNFGKELKAQFLENESRAERMKSMDFYGVNRPDLGPGSKPSRVLSWENSLHSSPVRKNSFRLDPSQIAIIDPSQAADRAKLGAEFNQGFNSFVDQYTSSTGQGRNTKSRWHYVEAKSAAVAGAQATIAEYDPRNLDPVQGKAKIDETAHQHDIKTQSSEGVQEIVASFREQRKDALTNLTGKQKQLNQDASAKKGEHVVLKDVDSIQLAYEDMGFGQSKQQLELSKQLNNGKEDPKAVASLVVVSINRAITATEKHMNDQNEAAQARMPSSANPNAPKPVVTPSVTVDIKKFDEFLDEIWPSSLK